jgi:phospholipid transport system substrate-binding protein
MRKLIYPLILILFILAMPLKVIAQEDPDILLKRVTNELVFALREQDKLLKQNPDKIYDIIDQILVPHVDWHSMAQWVVGRHAWQRASEADRKQFANEFKDLLIRTYASTLRAYNNQTIEYLPIRGGFAGKDRVQVSSRIKEPGRESIRVNYRLVNKGNAWRVYDITIEGVSLLKGFQSQFAEEAQRGGLKPLIKRLHTHNEKPLR